MKLKTPKKRTCPECGKKFIITTREKCNQKYCTPKCKKTRDNRYWKIKEGLKPCKETKQDKENRRLRELNRQIKVTKGLKEIESIYFTGRVCAK